MSRLVSNLLIVASIAVLGGTAYYFYVEYDRTLAREEALIDTRELAKEAGPCEALVVASRLRRDADFDTRRTIEAAQRSLSAEIVGYSGRRAQMALLGAAQDGLVDVALCEQIRLEELGSNTHPVLALLLITREEADPCQDGLAWEKVLRGLSSHRVTLLRGLLADVGRLRCLSPASSYEVAAQAAELAYADTQAFDDLDILRIGKFLTTWVPLQSAQLGCAVETRGDISRLGNAIGCSADQVERILTRYRYAHPLPGKGEAPAQTAGSEVFLLHRDNAGSCDVRTTSEPAALHRVACADLQLLSDVHVAVLVETVRFGRLQADLIAGLATYDGRSHAVGRPTAEVPRRSWFSYSREGRPGGTAHIIDLADLAQESGTEMSELPLRDFCENAGAKYCYDVDWARLVTRSEGEGSVYLSRPLAVFLEPLSADDATALFPQAFGREPKPESMVRALRLGSEGLLALESTREGVEMRWRLSATGAFVAQSFGTGEGGSTPPRARLLSALDLENDGRPELVVERTTRHASPEGIKDAEDEIVLLRLDATGKRFENLNRLTIREY